MMPRFETVIGLEVHLQFATRSKIFCGCANEFGRPPNTLTCPVCLGLPGALPVLNREALVFAIKVALGLNASVQPVVKFDRKNYFYPDLPKGYQISQYDMPIAHDGWVEIGDEARGRRIRIHRAHLEEDAGKLVHGGRAEGTLVDYNRTGTPLMEIVTEPDITSPREAFEFLNTLKLRLRYLRVSDCDMEKGSLRCDANISLRPAGAAGLGTKTEIKNLNSFRAVRAALEYEEKRQAKVLSAGGRIEQETRLWDEGRRITRSMRSKEEAHDYRYFPEPDLVPFHIEDEEIVRIREGLPEFPEEKRDRFRREYGLTDYDAGVLVQDPDLADFFEACTALGPDARTLCHWITGPVAAELKTRGVSCTSLNLSPQALADLVTAVAVGRISRLAAKEILPAVIDTGEPVAAVIEAKGLAQLSDEDDLSRIVDQVIEEQPRAVAQVREGREQVLGFLIGQAMRKTGGRANPKTVKALIKRRLSDA